MLSPYYLVIQSTYSLVECALFAENTCLATATIDKKQATEQTIVSLNALLKNQDISVSTLDFIVANQGPAPFTTLRVILATVNGIAFATDVPLIGIDGLDALMQEHGRKDIITIVLLNAFNHEVYYALYKKDTLVKKGYSTVNSLLDEVIQIYPHQPFYLIGNGVHLYRKTIKEMLAAHALIASESTQFCSLQQIGQMGLKRWKKQKDIEQKLLPLYLKE